MQENKNEKVNESERAPGMKPRLAIYHANAKGTGCAIKMELRPAVGAADGEFNDSDLRLAIGRVLCARLKGRHLDTRINYAVSRQ